MSVARPLFLQNLTDYTADEFRNLISAVFNTTGVLASGLAVAPNNPVGMTVLVAPGQVLVPAKSAVNGKYVGRVVATETVTIAAASSLARKDNIVAEVDDTFYADGTSEFKVYAVAGTPSGTPVPPTVASNQLVLAEVYVGALVSTITAGNITDKRVNAKLNNVPMVQHGTFNFVFSASSNATATVTFPVAFPGVPDVTAMVMSITGNTPIDVNYYDNTYPTATQCRFIARVSTGGIVTGTYKCSYIAVYG